DLHLVDDRLGADEVRARLQLLAATSLDQQNKSIQALQAALGDASSAVDVLDRLAFKSQNRYSAVHVRVEQTERILVLGAFEALQTRLDEAARERSEAIWRRFLPSGLRLLLFAEAVGSELSLQGSLAGLRLRPLALLALSDELRPEARAV